MARPKEFSREEVLDRAIEVFWARGYEGTSVQELVDRMGINRGSIYDTFGDKHRLFLEALDRYEKTLHTKILAELNDLRSPRRAVERVFDTVIRECACDSGRRGCFLTNSAIELSGHDRETAERVQANLERVEAAFERALQAAQEKGEMSSRHEPRALARFLTGSLQGLRVMAKAAAKRSVLQDIAKVTLSVLE